MLAKHLFVKWLAFVFDRRFAAKKANSYWNERNGETTSQQISICFHGSDFSIRKLLELNFLALK